VLTIEDLEGIELEDRLIDQIEAIHCFLDA